MRKLLRCLTNALNAAPHWWWWSVLLAVAWLLAVHIDVPVSRWLLAHRDLQPWLIFRATLWPLGSGLLHAALLVLLLLIFCILGHKRGTHICKWLLLTLVIATLTAYTLKRIVRRPRPEHLAQQPPPIATQLNSSEWHSFPSGDMLATTSLVWVLWLLLRRPRDYVWLFVIPALVALQRLSAARHYPSDLVASLLLAMWIRIAIGRLIDYRERARYRIPRRSG